MQQAINASTVLSVPGDGVANPHGRYTFTAQITVDGAHSLTVMQGPNHISEAGFTTTDREAASAAYRSMRDAAENGGSPADLAAARLAALTDELHRSQRRGTYNPARVNYLNGLLDSLDTPAQRAEFDALTADIATTISQPKTFRELRAAHQAGINRQRAEVAGR